MTLVIGLHGAKGSGKDQFYKAVKAAFPQLDVRKIAYADPIKNEVSRIFGLQSEEEYDAFKRTTIKFNIPRNRYPEPRLVEGRQVVREIGMMMRSYDEGQFVRYVEDEIRKAPQAVWCITDLRFDNELKSIKNELNGIVIKIKRGGVEFDGHITETEFPDEVCSSIIHNVGLSLEQYNEVVVQEMNKIMQTIALVKEHK